MLEEHPGIDGIVGRGAGGLGGAHEPAGRRPLRRQDRGRRRGRRHAGGVRAQRRLDGLPDAARVRARPRRGPAAASPPALVDRVLHGPGRRGRRRRAGAAADRHGQAGRAGERVAETLDRSALRGRADAAGLPGRAAAGGRGARPATTSRAATDCASLVERAGGRVVCVEGDPLNLKVTTRADLRRCERLLAERPRRTPADARRLPHAPGRRRGRPGRRGAARTEHVARYVAHGRARAGVAEICVTEHLHRFAAAARAAGAGVVAGARGRDDVEAYREAPARTRADAGLPVLAGIELD